MGEGAAAEGGVFEWSGGCAFALFVAAGNKVMR